ncbi:Repeat domain-containing protein [Nannocystis exedens]|uniref:Repeat domain-containing protein n=1 Tax=Nannocystis exedens TaxID=54 RepID=A0A1I1V329_9BACT|nr:CRTAC1 family protein [Nannocystis exedens]PCC72250.1 ASPIC and UnbV [Nannocystis exedens]SFD76408.1 Repeat domain-containing protein [Nannocystis exedens]
MSVAAALTACGGEGSPTTGSTADTTTGTTDAATTEPTSTGTTEAPTTGEPGFTCTPLPLTPAGQGFFRDISDASGMRVDNFVPDPPTPIPINDHSRLAFADLNGDGFDDIVAHSLFPNPQQGVPFEHLVYLNDGDGTFTHFSDESGLRAVQAGFFAFGDVDNDGDQDVFAGLDIELEGEHNRVFLNDGAARFTEVPDAGVAVKNLAGNAVFADFNGDANLDLFVGNGQTSYAVSDQLFFGYGDGTFQDVTSVYMPGDRDQPSNGSVACDYDDDGDLDIFVSTYGVSVYGGHNHLWENDGTGKFTEVGLERGFAALATGNYWLASTGMGMNPEPDVAAEDVVGSNGFGIQCEDATGDGLPDVFLTAISHPVDGDYSRKWSDPSQLLVNGGPDAGYAFKNEYLARGLPFNEGDIDGAMVDFDNDGRLDLSVSRDAKYEPGYSEIEQQAWFGLMHQEADGSFTSVGPISGINDSQATPARMKQAQNHAWADIDHDGDLDLLVGGRDIGGAGRPNFLFENRVGQDNLWMSIRLRGDGDAINRDAIGARVTVRYADWSVSREVKSGRGTYNSHDSRTLHFGLGDLGCDYEVDVRWPDGTTRTFSPEELPTGRLVVLDYLEGVLVDP